MTELSIPAAQRSPARLAGLAGSKRAANTAAFLPVPEMAIDKTPPMSAASRVRQVRSGSRTSLGAEDHPSPSPTTRVK